MPVSPHDAAELAKAIAQLYRDAETQLLVRIAEHLSKGLYDPGWEERQLLEVQRAHAATLQLLEILRTKGMEHLTQTIRAAYNRGVAMAGLDLRGIGTMDGIAFGGINPHAVEAFLLAHQGVGESLAAATLQIASRADRAYRDVIQEVAGRAIAGTVTRREAAAQAVAKWAKVGIARFTDTRGRNWDIASYAEMATRTVTGQAMIQGHMDQLQDVGHDLVMVSDAPEECRLCLIPGTVVEGPAPTGRTRLEYSGNVIRIVTASGKDLTGTPDHAVLTPLGWRALKDLHVGDQVVSDSGQQRYAGVMPDHVQVPTVIEEAGESRVPVLFAGPTRRELDGDRTYREVRAVLPDGYLLGELNASFGQPLRDLLLVDGIGSAATSTSFGYLAPGGSGHGTSGGKVRGLDHLGALLRRGIGPALSHGPADHGGSLLMAERCHVLNDPDVPWPSLHSSAAQVVSDYPGADAEGGAELLRSLSGDVALDEIVSVGWREFRGHVWDLTTEPSWFYANGIVTHNCRPWEGKVLSLTGKTPRGRNAVDGYAFEVAGTLREAQSSGLFHPSCRHRTVIYVPGRTRPMHDTADPEGDRLRQKQRAMERRVRELKRQVQVLEPLGDTQELRDAKAKLRTYERDFAAWRKDHGRKNLQYRTSITSR